MFSRCTPFLFVVLSLMGSARAATIFTTQLPAPGDSSPNSRSVELGVRFRSDAAGQITGLRFYKTAGNTGAHTGHLWTNTGVLLGTLNFTGETATGWQTASFAVPVAIQAGTTYVASYHTAAFYAVTRQTFAATGIDNPPLHALRDGVDGANGLYAYSSAAAFPNRGTRSSNYWVDVVFTAAGSTAPAILGLSPSTATAGGAGFSLQVLGTDFLSSATVRWNGAARPTTFVSSATLSALISPADIVSAGTAAVTVLNPPPGGGLSGAAVFTVAAGPDGAPPTVAISSPAADAVIGGTVAVVAAAFDNVAVATVQFRLDGADLGAPDLSPPYAAVWNTAASSDGPHGLSAVAWDAAGNASTSAAVTVAVDNTPPVISSFAVVELWASSATAAWITDEPATSQVEYGTTTDYGSVSALDASAAALHSRILNGLASGTTYHVRALSADAAGNLALSGDLILYIPVVPDLAPPTVTVSSPVPGAVIGGTVAVVAAAFDDVAVATVQFRLDGEDLGPPDAAPPYALVWDTTASSEGPHALGAVAWDAEGNSSTAPAVSVTVDNTPPVIGSETVTDVGISSAAFAWRTDEPATSQVEYGMSGAYGSATALDSSTVVVHAALLSGLSAGTVYHYRILSADAAGNLAVSDGGTFTTSLPAPGACVSSAGSWVNEPLAPQVSSFTVAFDVTPSSAGMSASIGLSSGPAGSLAGLAAAVRFNPQGFIDVRHSTAYARMATVAYSTGTSYRFDLRVNASAHIFDAYVTPAGGARTLLAKNYTFHSNQSTATVLANLGLFASSGAATMCDLSVAPSSVPWWDGVRELYATAAGSKTWYSTWDNGINRAFGRAKDPTDPWFDAAHGTASYLVDAASGVFKISGNTPRMYIHHPEFVAGSSSATVANAPEKQWRDVEVTVYGMRIADSNVAWAGIDGIARANHGITGDETVHLCDSRGIGARFRHNGRLDFEKETRHPTAYAVNTTTTALWPSGTAMPFNVWIGFKYAVYDLPNGNVKVESYMDMTDGDAGGSWTLVNQFEDDGANWGGGTPCAAGVNPQERLTNGAVRPGSESGLPNVSVYFRSDGVGTNGLLYKKMSIREIVAPAGGMGPSAAAGPPEPGAVAPAAAEDFVFRDLYAFPNPSRRGERVTIRLQAGVADAVDVNILDLSGHRVGGGSAAGPVLLDDGNGKGPQFTYDYHWDVRGAFSAVYLYAVTARKQGRAVIGRTGKVALIK